YMLGWIAAAHRDVKQRDENGKRQHQPRLIWVAQRVVRGKTSAGDTQVNSSSAQISTCTSGRHPDCQDASQAGEADRVESGHSAAKRFCRDESLSRQRSPSDAGGQSERRLPMWPQVAIVM